MKMDCAPVCYSCDYLPVESRCPIDPNAPHVFGAGDLGLMFDKLTKEPYLSEYSVEILSKPPGPWVIQMDNILSKDEAEKMIDLAFSEGFERSADVGKLKADGSFVPNVNDKRTSTNTWLVSYSIASYRIL
jgi:prolyl 4-hydroxylase